jgi:uncharacterized protein
MATIIFKPTEACNAACAYCEVDHKGWRATKIMPAETLELLFVRINEFLLECSRETVELIWHGGEPLLLGEDYFSNALSFQEKHCGATSRRIRHRIQTNLTLFSPKFTDIFRRLGITNIGTSYDPVEGVRLLKGKRDANEYNRQFMQGVSLLEKEGFRWGLIYVVTKLSLDKPLDIFHFLTNLACDGGVMFNPLTAAEGLYDHLTITAEEFTEFLGAIFTVWWNCRERYPRVEPFHSLTRAIASENHPVYFCADSGNCANTHINLGPQGRWSHCGRSADCGQLDYGSIFDRTIADVFADPKRDELRRRGEILLKGECAGCKYWTICHGGCPLDGWHNTGSFLGKTTWCHSKREFIERYFLPITGIRANFAQDDHYNPAIAADSLSANVAPPDPHATPGMEKVLSRRLLKTPA